jgi:phospholipase A1
MPRTRISRLARTGLLPLLLQVVVTSALAQASDCRTIVPDSDRLACYDRSIDRAVSAPDVSARDAERAAFGDGATARQSPMAAAWGVPGEATERFTMRPYKPVYLLAFNYNSQMNESPGSPTQPVSPEQGLKRTEVKYQLSFKTRIASGLFGDNGDVWAAYTQSSHWQLYSPAISRPFRETNYEPEAVFVWKTRADILGATLRYTGIGINHQSNGRSDPLSRSWNRVIAQAGFERGDWGATVRVWRRIEESGSDDDNPDIEDFMGRGELLLTRDAGEHLLAVTLRPSLSSHHQGHGAFQADWSFPLSGRLKGHLQYFVGRGESLIDYNHFARTLGIGVSLVAWR